MRGDVVARGRSGSCRARRPGRETQPLTLIQSNSSIRPSSRPRNPSRDRQHRVAAIHADPHGDADGGVHPRRRIAGVEHGQPQRTLTGLGTRGRAWTIVRSSRYESVKLPPRIAIAASNCPVGDQAGDRSRRRHALHQRRARQAVPADADELRLAVRASRAAGGLRRTRARCPGSGRTRSASRRAGRDRGS